MDWSRRKERGLREEIEHLKKSMIWFSTCIVMLLMENRGLSSKSTNGTERKEKPKERNE